MVGVAELENAKMKKKKTQETQVGTKFKQRKCESVFSVHKQKRIAFVLSLLGLCYLLFFVVNDIFNTHGHSRLFEIISTPNRDGPSLPIFHSLNCIQV